MDETEARTVFLVRALEETADGPAPLLTPAEGRQASEVVRAGLPKPGRTLRHQEWSERFVVQRAQRLLQDALARRPGLRGLVERPALFPLAQVLVAALGFAAGFASDALANPHRINLLSAPLLGVVAWNWLLALLWLVSRVLPRRPRRHARGLAGLLGGLAAWPARWRRGGLALAGRFGRTWAHAAAPLWHARIRATLHLGAASVALGLLAYVFARALPNEFSVGWESQLIKTPEGAHQLLGLLFLPVSSLPGLPGVAPFTLEEITRMHHWAGSNAALADRWLLMLSALLVLGVALPRLLLWGWQSHRARRLARRFPLDLADPYFARLVADGSGQRWRLVVWPYALALDAARTAALAGQATEVLGGGETALTVQPGLAYGDAPQAAARRPAATEGELMACAALLSLSATPEAETHGAFLQRLAQSLGPQLLVLLDAGAFTARLGRGERLREREALWREFLRPLGLQRVHVVDLGA
ncbi:DUF2868 domain-containing protein [Azohydromonas lata]|nr:DUF2868 domain-containing protein [Azohydromonas lata]